MEDRGSESKGIVILVVLFVSFLVGLVWALQRKRTTIAMAHEQAQSEFWRKDSAPASTGTKGVVFGVGIMRFRGGVVEYVLRNYNKHSAHSIDAAYVAFDCVRSDGSIETIRCSISPELVIGPFEITPVYRCTLPICEKFKVYFRAGAVGNDPVISSTDDSWYRDAETGERLGK